MRFPDKIQPICDEVYAYYLKRTNNPTLAEEVVEFAASECWCRWHTKDLPSLKRLMFTVAKNHSINLHCRRKHRITTINLDQLPARSSSGPEEEMIRQLHQGLSRLPFQSQKLVSLIYYQNQTKKKAAEIMGVSLATIKRWHKDALRALRPTLPVYSD